MTPCETHLFAYTFAENHSDVTSGGGTSGGLWWVHVYCGVDEQVYSRDTGILKRITESAENQGIDFRIEHKKLEKKTKEQGKIVRRYSVSSRKQ